MITAPSIKHPGAVLPVVMSLAAVGLVLGHAAIFGVRHEADEGAAAHIFQLLMVAQLPIIALFAFRWLPKAPRRTLYWLGLQLAAVLAACASVYFFT